MADDASHKDALEAYRVCSEAAEENERCYEEDYEFWRLDKQWAPEWIAARSVKGQERPMFTFNRGPTFARQVINDIRQNRPTVKYSPADSGADIETALVYTGIHRNINNLSRGDVARDTAAECAVYGGFGYYRVDIRYACDDTFDQDIWIDRIVNPLSIKGDPYSTGADSLDWMMAFAIDVMTPDAFKEAYPEADPVSFDMMDDKVRADWREGNDIVVAEYWKRSKAMKTILLLSDGKVVDEEAYLEPGKDEPGLKDILDAGGIVPQQSRQIETYVVDQCILNGQETLTQKVRWVGKYIPIIPVYGEEINFKGKRMFWSMLHRARNAQEQFNYHETTATELYALSPRIPFIGKKGAFKTDPNWATANTQNHPFLEYDGNDAPQRQPLDAGPMMGAMALSKQAGDNLKAVLGMYDASIGNRSNETSGVAIENRDRQADVGNFHFSDNVSRAISCEGTIIADLIPKVYGKRRIARVLGDDGTTQDVQIGQRQRVEQQVQPGQEPNPPKIGALDGVFDLAQGKYDVTVEAGPSYTTQRQETAAVVGELMRSNEMVNAVGSDILVRNLDLKDGDELARRLKKMLPPQVQDNEQAIPPQIQAQMQQMEQALAEANDALQKAQAENMKGAGEVRKAEVENRKLDIEEKKVPAEVMEQQIKLLTAQKALFEAQANLEKTRAEIVQTQQQMRNDHEANMQQVNTAISTGQNEQVNAAVPAIMQAIENVRVIATKPRKRRAVAVKKGNGVYELESMEELAPDDD